MALLTAMSLRPRVREPTIRTRKPQLRAWGLSLNGKRVRFLGFDHYGDRGAISVAASFPGLFMEMEEEGKWGQ